jgi:integrase
MPKPRMSRVYVRMQGGVPRYYGDFRDFADVGGSREALIPMGAERATTDEKLAQAIVAERLAELEGRRRHKQRREPEEEAWLASYSAYHLIAKARSKRWTAQWLDAMELHLTAAIEFFCNDGKPLPRDAEKTPILTGICDRELSSIDVTQVQAYVEWLGNRPTKLKMKSTFSSSTQRKYLNSLSNLYRRAISERKVPVGYNPVSALIDKPQDATGRGEAHWLEVHEAALLLESARVYVAPQREGTPAIPYIYPLLATFLLTGGRPAEVFGLDIRDVSFEREVITFRPSQHRRLKTDQSWRTIPLWPQLAAILEEYLRGPMAPKKGLLFPSVKTGALVRDIRKVLDHVATRAGWDAGDIRPYAFRHTYTAARLQTLDRGYPISNYTVARELGHGGDALVKRVYGHLGTIRHRAEVVEYRIEYFVERLGDRLDQLYNHAIV